MKGGDLAQQVRRLDRVRSRRGDGEREGAYTPLGCCELAGQTGIRFGRANVADQSGGGNSYDDGRAAVDPGQNMLCGDWIWVTATWATV